MKKQPQKRLGRGLESLINGGLRKSPAPEVRIDNVRIEKSEESNSQEVQADSLDSLNELLKKTHQEAQTEEISGEASPSGTWKIPSPVQKPQFPTASASVNTPSVVPSNAQGVFMLISLKHIQRSPYQRRKEFRQESIKELADSIRSEGLMQPVVVRALKNGGYELIAGERRMRACQSIGMEVIPARVVNVADASAAVMGLIENLQREDLNPVDEARGYGMLLTDFHMTQEQISAQIGKARTTIANSLRLLMLEPEILGYVAKNQLTLGHAKVLLGLPEGSTRVMLARTIVEQGLSVRQAEGLIRKQGTSAGPGTARAVTGDAELLALGELQKKILAKLNAKVKFQHGARGGKLIVYYKNNGELEEILKRMGV
jgi:ParB family chromosome partitioning protein